MKSFKYFFILVFMSLNGIHTIEESACSNFCSCTKRVAYCDHSNLTFIPKLPDSINSIYFRNGNLTYVSKQTFERISHLSLNNLVLINNRINNIEVNSLRNFTSLRRLDLSVNNLTIQSIYNLMKDLKYIGGLNNLLLRNVGLNNLPNDLFHDLQKSHMHYLDISENNFRILNFEIFKFIPKLYKLRVLDSKIEKIIFAKLPKLNKLSLQANKLRELPSICKNSSAYFPRLTDLNLVNNTICEYIPENLDCLKRLQKLNLENNCIVDIGTNFFSKMKSLEVLLLSKQLSPSKKLTIAMYAFNNTQLRNLQLHGNNILVKHLDSLAFANCPNLHYLEISNNHLSDLNMKTNNKLNQILSQVTNLRSLGMTYAFLYTIPKAVRLMQRLENLQLRQNAIETWSNGFFNNNSNLTELNLQKNTIKKVTTEMFNEKLRKQLKIIDIGQNPMNCDCELVWFIQWVNLEKSRVFSDYPLGYHCLNITERLCIKDSPLYSSITAVSSIMISMLLLISLVYKYRWVIKYQIYIWRHQGKKYRKLDEIEYLYDVFVSYCAGDSDWVLDQLLPKLEDEENLTLCVHERDFSGGRMIIDNIVESIENSRRVLIVLSNDFAKSDWCQLEVTLAQKRVLNECMPPLTVVLLEEIDSRNMSNCINALLKTTTYITWSGDENSSLFWERLKGSFKES